MKVLVTGFGPFPRVLRNPTEALVEGLPDRLGPARLVRRVLPTVYAACETEIEILLRDQRPDVCLCFGVAGPGVIRLETTARNRGLNDGPDQSGAVKTDAIATEGPETYASTLPLAEIAEALTAEGVPHEYSDDAGGYVCNHLFYAARHAVARHGLATACGFVHVPEVRPEVGWAAEIAAFDAAARVILGVLAERSDLGAGVAAAEHRRA